MVARHAIPLDFADGRMFDSSGGEYHQTAIEEGLCALQRSGAEVEYAARLTSGQKRNKKKRNGKRSKRPQEPPHPKKRCSVVEGAHTPPAL